MAKGYIHLSKTCYYCKWLANLKISLTENMETLLIPLYGRAKMSQKGLFKDEDAELAIKEIDYDFSKLDIKEKTQILLSIRGALIDDFVTQYLSDHPDSTVLYLGCGLDSRAKRLGYPSKLWYDLDFPEVINIKKQLFAETETYRYVPSSVTDWNWMEKIETHNRPILVIAEGLLMYLNEQDIQALFVKMRDKFKEATLIFDAYSETTAKHAKNHPSLKNTDATVQWGINSPKTLEEFGNGITYIKTIFFTDENATNKLPKRYRIIFGVAGKFKAAKEAHRILVVNLAT
jgi:O-methyltransferase involved in polyketide biosynthesis